MTSFAFIESSDKHHQVTKRAKHIQVNGRDLPVRALSEHHFVTEIDQRPVHIKAVAHGDQIYLQLAGKTCVIERVDPTRHGAGSGGVGQGGATAPMPGVVVSWIAQAGQSVQAGEPLLVIESMKLQMTIEAPQTGTLEDLPFQPGQTFQRGAVLARIRAEESLA